MPDEPVPTKVISPSRLSRFYYHECERYLRYSAVRKDAREEEGVPTPPYDISPVTKAILDTGFDWEEDVVTDLLQDAVHIGDSPDGEESPLTERVVNQAAAEGLLADLEPGRFIYQAELRVPDSFYERYGLDRELAWWPPCRPDLIEACETEDGPTVLRVIDVKASPGVKLSHRIQATVYSLVLETLLGELGITDRRVSDQAGIWLAQQNKPELFELRMLKPPIEQFLEHELEPLLSKPASEAPWHVYFRCEWCEFFDHCREEMRESDSVSRVPYLTTHAKRYLERSHPPVRSLDDLAELLADGARHRELDGCASLQGKGDRLATQLGALQSGEVRAHAGSSLAMPLYENVRIVLTAQTEPVSGQLYAYGLYAQGLADVFGADKKKRTIARIAPDGDLDSIVELQRALVRDLWEIFDAVDAYNAEQAEWKDKKALQAFVFDTYEHRLIVETLLQRLSDPEVAEQALKTLFQLQGPDLLRAEEHPAREVFFPIICLSEVLRDRLALPAEVSYRFADAVRFLQPEDYGFEYDEREYFSFVLSNQMRSDIIHSIWYGGKADRIEWIESEICRRLWAANSLVNGTRERLDEEGALFAYAPKFELPRSFDYSSPLLSRLAFLAQYESVLSHLDTRTQRMAPLDERIRAGDAVVVNHRRGNFDVTEISENLELGPSNFPSWILAERTDDGQQAQLGFDDYFNRGRVWVRKGLRLWLADIVTVDGSPAETVSLALTEGPDSPDLSDDAEYVLCPRFTDFTTQPAVDELCAIDDGDEGGVFLDLLDDPARIASKVKPLTCAEPAKKLATAHGMTPSQLEALEGLTQSRLQLVWGPPGTGKTYFLAMAILALAEAHRAAGEPLRVMLSAFTHAAIENALRTIAAIQDDTGIYDGELSMAKLSGVLGQPIGPVEDVDRDAGDAWLAGNEIGVLAGTVWALRRTEPGSVDLVAIDEGSQVRVPESAIAIRRMRDAGRLLIAGDDRQLPPIVQGAYPDPAEDEPLLHRSIFECLRRADPNEDFTSILLENWRMNETLCRYPRGQIYVSGYQSATTEIRDRQLATKEGNAGSAWAKSVIDPSSPLVVCVLEGVQASAENVLEAGLVAEAAVGLRRRLLDPDGTRYSATASGDAAFWRDGLFIVSPHHAQNRAIRKALDEARNWKAPPFVDTVDKMQGQECDAVIVSYGVSDVEYALNEAEFIYSLNRLNVSITRARSKTIVFLPLPLLEPPVAAFEEDRLAEGIAFMQGLWRFAESEGTEHVRNLGSGAILRTHCVPA